MVSFVSSKDERVLQQWSNGVSSPQIWNGGGSVLSRPNSASFSSSVGCV